MAALWLLRKFARGKQKRWRQDEVRNALNRKKEESRARENRENTRHRIWQGVVKMSGVRFGLTEPLTPDDIGQSESEPSFTGQLVERTRAYTLEMAKRVALQMFQWWFLSLIGLVYKFLSEIVIVHEKYDIKVNTTTWRIQTPHEFDSIPRWLAVFSIYSYVALFVIFAVSLVSIVLQVLTHYTSQVVRCRMLLEAGSGFLSLTRDTAIQVLLLPMVYGLLSAKNVSGMWSKMTNNPNPALQCWNWSDAQKAKIQADIYSSNFALADMYEAYALLCFGIMVGKVLREELQTKIRLEVFKGFQDLLLIDVTVFNFVCAVGAFYSLFLTWTKFRLGVDICEDYSFVCSLQSYLLGANWCASSIAIYNLYTTEHKFKDLSTMRKFRPSLKFWSIKVMVLVAFWAALVMAVIKDVCHLTEDQSNLLDASLRIYVMALVSLLNLAAWWPWHEWYDVVDKGEMEAVVKQAERLEMNRQASVLMEVGVKNVPPGITRLVQELLPSVSEDEADDWQKVAAHIKALDEDALLHLLFKGSQIGWVLTARHMDCGRIKHRKAMVELSHEERKEALMEHLQSFYPEV